MDTLLWFLQASESALVISQKKLSSFIFLAYLVVCFFDKRPSFLAAFFMSCALFELKLFDPVSESNLYLLTFLIYSYVITCNRNSKLTVLACGNMIVVCMVLAYNAKFYGYSSYYGEIDRFIYDNIKYISLFSHGFIICTLINFKRIRDNIRSFFDSVCNVSRNSVYFVVM